MNGLTVYTEDELQKIHQLELDALKEFIRICDALSIEWFMMDGSAIGAVRHKGFIPWDDDMDIGMTRENYRRFLKEAPSRLDGRFFLQTPYDSKTNPYFYTKLRINDTKFVEYCNRKLKMHHGVYIDICPFDEVPDDENKNKRQFVLCQLLIRLFVIRQSPELSAPPRTAAMKLKACLRWVLHIMLKAVPYRCLAGALERETTKYNGTGQSAYSFLHYPVRNTDCILMEELYPIQDGTFENLTVKLAGNTDAYLRRHYGDYMTYPPAEEQYGHKPYYVEL